MNKKIIYIINARGGSKRIKNKNIIEFNSKPLIYWTIQAAKKSNIYDEIFVNTDSHKIAEISKKFGAEVPFLRPKKYSGDTVSSAISTKYFLDKLRTSADFFSLLQPTSPLRTYIDIIKFHKFINKSNYNSAVTISILKNKASPEYSLKNDYSLIKIKNKKYTKSQIYFLNGSIYYNDIRSFLKYEKFIFRYTKGFKMSKKRSIDIDTYEDLFKSLKVI